MKAVIYTKYGAPDVLHLAEVDQPTPEANEVLIKVHAASATTGDANMRGFTFVPPGFGPLPRLMFGIFKPRKPILGTEVAGEVVEVGAGVTRFHVGDQVFGINSNEVGAYAEYVCWPEDSPLAIKPASISYEDAVAIPFGAGTALFYVRDKGNVQPGQKVLVNGASGGVGNYIVQLAKYYGAEVTGVCSTRNLDFAKSLGADHVIDYTEEDFTQNGETYDMIFDTVPGKVSFERCKGSLKPNGLYLAVAGGMSTLIRSALPTAGDGKKIVAGSPQENAEDLAFLAQLVERGKITPVIDRRYTLEETAEAHRYVDQGHKRGTVVITVSHA